ncbi:MAG: hypothetical protein ACRD1X_14640 [Vicinamibacteria bacterium]
MTFRRKIAPAGVRRGTPLHQAKEEWTKALEATDAHSTSCRPCNTSASDAEILAGRDPYTPCPTAKGLDDAEEAARKAYLGLGGRLPALGLIVLLVLHSLISPFAPERGDSLAGSPGRDRGQYWQGERGIA